MSLVYDILYSSWIKPKGNRLEFSDFNEEKCSISQNLVSDEKLFPCWFDLNESKQWSYFFSWENCNFPKFIHSNQIEFVGRKLDYWHWSLSSISLGVFSIPRKIRSYKKSFSTRYWKFQIILHGKSFLTVKADSRIEVDLESLSKFASF